MGIFMASSDFSCFDFSVSFIDILVKLHLFNALQ